MFVGLGNPGAAYEKTRHNVGFLSLDSAAETEGVKLARPLFSSFAIGKKVIDGHRCIFVKPLTYMNRSGIILPRLFKKYQITPASLVVLCDNMDLPPGSVRVRKGGGTAGHRGLRSIQHEIADSEFIRIYIGIGRPGEDESVVDHVLGIPGSDEALELMHGAARAAQALRMLVSEPIERVMNEFNRKDTHRSGAQ